MTEPYSAQPLGSAAIAALREAGWVFLPDTDPSFNLGEALRRGEVEVLELVPWGSLSSKRDEAGIPRDFEASELLVWFSDRPEQRPTLELVTDVPASASDAEDLYGVSDFELWMRSWGAARSTLSHRLVMARRVRALWPDPRCVTTQELAVFLADPDFAPWTRRTYWVSLRALFGWLAETDRVEKDVTATLRRPSVPAKKPRPLSQEDAERALAGADGPLRAALVLGLYAGLRVHEAAKVRGEDFTSAGLHVVGKGGKEATLPIHPVLAEVAEKMPSAGYWFPGPVDGHLRPTKITERATAHFRAHGIAEGSFHRLRHTFATNLVRSGAPLHVVRQLLRHSSLATTENYLEVAADEGAAAIRLLSAVEAPRGETVP